MWNTVIHQLQTYTYDSTVLICRNNRLKIINNAIGMT